MSVANTVRFYSDIKRIFGKSVSFRFPVTLPPDKTVAGAFARCALTIYLSLAALAALLAFVLGKSPAATVMFGIFALFQLSCLVFIPARYGYLKNVTEGNGGDPTPSVGSFARNALLWSPILIVPLTYMLYALFSAGFTDDIVLDPDHVHTGRHSVTLFFGILWLILFLSLNPLGHYNTWVALNQQKFQDAGMYATARMQNLQQDAKGLATLKKGGVFEVLDVRNSGSKQATLALQQVAGGSAHGNKVVYNAQAVTPGAITLIDDTMSVIDFYPAEHRQWLYNAINNRAEIEQSLTPPEALVELGAAARGPLKNLFPFVNR